MEVRYAFGLRRVNEVDRTLRPIEEYVAQLRAREALVLPEQVDVESEGASRAEPVSTGVGQ